MLCAALDAAGLVSYRVGLGDASLFPRALERAGVPRTRGRGSSTSSPRATSSGSSASSTRAGAVELLDIARTRGGIEVLDGVPEAEPLQALYGGLAPTTSRERVIFDLGLVRTLGYYTGAVFEVYDAAFGAPIGGGGRYDDLLGRFGRELPACGWALDVERVHLARLEEGR